MGRKVLIPMVAAAAVFCPIFLRFYVYTTDGSSDHAAHLTFIREGKIPVYPFYHMTVEALSGWSNDNRRLRKGAAAALTLAATAAAGLSAAYLASRTKSSTFTLTIICLGLGLVMPLPTWSFIANLRSFHWQSPSPPGAGLYLGQVTPNVWHNPTTIFAMPFAIAVYWVAAVALTNFTFRAAIALGITMVLSLLAKPNYVLALAPCLGLALAVEPMSNVDKIVRLFVVFIFPLAILWTQAAVLVGPKGSTSEEMLIAPFEVWRRFSKSITLSTFVGIAFPLSVLLSYRGRFDGETGLKLAWAAFATAILEYVLLKESGERETAGNWGWGMYFADHVVFLASCAYLLRQRTDRRKMFCYGVFLLHVACGGVNLARCMADPKWAVFY
jgi:hypothetical protein